MLGPRQEQRLSEKKKKAGVFLSAQGANSFLGDQKGRCDDGWEGDLESREGERSYELMEANQTVGGKIPPFLKLAHERSSMDLAWMIKKKKDGNSPSKHRKYVDANCV